SSRPEAGKLAGKVMVRGSTEVILGGKALFAGAKLTLSYGGCRSALRVILFETVLWLRPLRRTARWGWANANSRQGTWSLLKKKQTGRNCGNGVCRCRFRNSTPFANNSTTRA